MWRHRYRSIKSQSFTIGYKKTDSNEWHIVNIGKIDSTQGLMVYTLTGLSSGTEYYLIMYANNSIGKSNSSRQLTVITKGKIITKIRSCTIQIFFINISYNNFSGNSCTSSIRIVHNVNHENIYMTGYVLVSYTYFIMDMFDW